MAMLHDHDRALLGAAAPDAVARATAAQVREWMATVSLRLAGPREGPAVARLAALDDARAIAARSLADGRVVADPFARSARVLELLALHAGAEMRSRERWSRGRR